VTIEHVIRANLDYLKDHNVDYEFRMTGSKRYACVKIDSGRTLRFCPRTGSTIYGNKRFETKTAKGFLRFLDRLKTQTDDS